MWVFKFGFSKIQKNWCTVTVAPTIEHHDGIHGPLQTRGETMYPGGVSVSCLASRTRHECRVHYCFIPLLWWLQFESARCGDMLAVYSHVCIFFAYIFMHTLKYGILNLTSSDILIWLDSFPLLSQRTRTRHYVPINPNWQLAKPSRPNCSKPCEFLVFILSQRGYKLVAAQW